MLLWIGIGFGLNFFYLLISVFANEAFSEAALLSYEYIQYSKIGSKLLDNWSFFFFFIPLYHRLLQTSIIYKLVRAREQWEKELLAFVPLVVLFVGLSVEALWKWNLLNDFLLVAFKAFSLIFLAILLKATRYTSVWSKILLMTGFYSWAALQFFGIINPGATQIYIMDFIGFSVAFISKICIFIGVVLIVVKYERKKTEAVTEANTRRRELQKSSEFFENILKNTFHEITLPLNSLGSDIAQVAGLVNRDYRGKYRDLELNYERVRAIIAVAKSSYKPQVDDLEENNGIDRSVHKTISVNYLIEKSISSIKNTYKNITIEHFYGSNVLVKCNQSEIIQVFTNLIKNAIEAYEIGAEKRVVLRSVNQRRSGDGSNRSVIVEIEDFASGIEPQYLEKVWERGFSTKVKTENTIVRGEGLFVVQSLCQKNQVRLEMQSPVKMDHDSEGHPGTKFILYFIKNKG
jgi:signal transduction histidine kinase